MANSFNIGETVVCSITIKNSSGTLVDPSTSTTIKVYPSSITGIAMTQDTTGTYHYDFQTVGLLAGTYIIYYTATDGTRITIQEDSFTLS